jgi:hypothetical protein
LVLCKGHYTYRVIFFLLCKYIEPSIFRNKRKKRQHNHPHDNGTRQEPVTRHLDTKGKVIFCISWKPYNHLSVFMATKFPDGPLVLGNLHYLRYGNNFVVYNYPCLLVLFFSILSFDITPCFTRISLLHL